MPSGPTKPQICSDARALLHRYSEAVTESVRLHQAQFEAVLSGGSDADRFKLLIHEANDRKENAKYAYLRHLQEHGCWSGAHGETGTGVNNSLETGCQEMKGD